MMKTAEHLSAGEKELATFLKPGERLITNYLRHPDSSLKDSLPIDDYLQQLQAEGKFHNIRVEDYAFARAGGRISELVAIVGIPVNQEETIR